jgi:small subunit ribosomal protein S6
MHQTLSAFDRHSFVFVGKQTRGKEPNLFMRNYDLTFIVASDVTEEELNGVMTQVKGWVEEAKGSVNNVDQWGRRKLAYGISEYNEGFYVSYDCALEPKTTTELERNLKLAPKVIRHLLIRKDDAGDGAVVDAADIDVPNNVEVEDEADDTE